MATSEASTMQGSFKQPLPGLNMDVLVDLANFGLIEVKGDDSQKFLSSLFTGDVRLVTANQGQFTGWCDGKGRLLATFWLFMRDGSYYMLAPVGLVESLVTRLRQFLLRTKAVVTDVSTCYARIGLSGASVAAQIELLTGDTVPSIAGETKILADCVWVALPHENHFRWLVMGVADAVDSLKKQVEPSVELWSAEDWCLFDILAGISFVSAETREEFIPQMLNLEALGGLCFTKGCYPGQEVVARLQYRGQLKRRVYICFADVAQVPSPGAKLLSEHTTESVGMVVAAAKLPGIDRIALLAVVVIDQKAQGEIFLAHLQGPKLQFAD